MRVAVASDHAGFCQKSQVVNHIQSLGHEAVDLGPATDDRVDYPDFAHKVAWGVAEGEYDRGVLICGTGLGMAMTADKVPGVRAVAVQTPGFAELPGAQRRQRHLPLGALRGPRHQRRDREDLPHPGIRRRAPCDAR